MLCKKLSNVERVFRYEQRSRQGVATSEAADEWFKDNDPEDVVFGYEVVGEEAPHRS
jgi:hypothetical protein